MADLAYKPPGLIVRDFIRDDSFVRGIRGPVGSGKSTACCVEIMRRATRQKPGPDGIAKFRAIAIRNTNPELRTTTIKTWLDIFPEHKWGKFNWSAPYTHRIQKTLPENLELGLLEREMDLEVIFIPLDTPRDTGRLLSLEATLIWINEAREIEKPIVDATTMRVGRYPSAREGGATWYGVIMDTNPPDAEHWWPILSGETPIPEWMPEEEAAMLKPQEGWKFYNQPPAMHEKRDARGQVTGYELSSEAENAHNLPTEYYPRIVQGKTKSYIDVYVMNRLGSVEDGKPVHPTFRTETHVAKAPIEPSPQMDVWIGLDFGLTPAALLLQRSGRGQWLAFHEIAARDMGAIRFAELLRAELSRLCPWLWEGPGDRAPELIQRRLHIYGDPSGDQRVQTDETTPFEILRGAGVIAYPAPSNDPVLRQEAMDATLGRLIDGSLPGLLVSPTCKTFIAGMGGRYQYRRLQVSGEAKYEQAPVKNRWSHICEAGHYVLLGAGEGNKLIRGPKPMKATVAKQGWNVWDRQRQRQQGGRPRL